MCTNFIGMQFISEFLFCVWRSQSWMHLLQVDEGYHEAPPVEVGEEGYHEAPPVVQVDAPLPDDEVRIKATVHCTCAWQFHPHLRSFYKLAILYVPLFFSSSIIKLLQMLVIMAQVTLTPMMTLMMTSTLMMALMQMKKMIIIMRMMMVGLTTG